MLRTKSRNATTLLAAAILLSACSIMPIKQNKEMTNLYQHRWINSSTAHPIHDINSVAKLLADYDVIFFGELHTHPGVHLAQMQLFEALHQQKPELTLSLEQFERDTQSYVDDYLAGKIGEKYFIKKARAWNNYPTSYRPLVDFAKHHQLPVIAANAPKSTVVCIGRHGLDALDALTPEDRQHVAQNIHVSAGAYRDKFMAFMGSNASHGSVSENKMDKMMQKMSQRSFTAQVVRDDTMAESIARHLRANPQRQVMHLNGNFHSSQFLGTVERLQQRMPKLKIAVIDTITLDPGTNSWNPEELKNGNLLLLVKPLAEGFVKKENQQEWSKAILKKRKESGINCASPAN